MQSGKFSHINAVADSINCITFMEKRVQPVDINLDISN